MILPRKDENGEYYISYSQYESFTSEKAFGIDIPGRWGYILNYFLGYEKPDEGWAQFGSEVEDYICNRSFAENFKEEEKKLLEEIAPLGNFQKEIKLYILPGIYIKGFIDDATDDLKVIRDYKTASKKSAEKYKKPTYVQLDIYAGWVRQETGKLPEKGEVLVIERKGNCFGQVGRRDLLSVGQSWWIEEKQFTDERTDAVLEDMRRVVKEISLLYEVYLKVKGA
jgi:hypothetical protein